MGCEGGQNQPTLSDIGLHQKISQDQLLQRPTSHDERKPECRARLNTMVLVIQTGNRAWLLRRCCAYNVLVAVRLSASKHVKAEFAMSLQRPCSHVV